MRSVRSIYRIIGTLDYYATASGHYYLFPNRIQSSPLAGTLLPRELNQLAELDWGITFAFGKVVFSQALSITSGQIIPAAEPNEQLTSKSGFVTMGIGYTAYETSLEGTNTLLRIAPVIELGFGGLILTDNYHNSYLTGGGAIDISCILPLIDLKPNPKTRLFSYLAAYTSLRIGYNQHFSTLDVTPLHGVFAARATIGIGIHGGIDPTYTEEY
jgi:hypothetical protein